MIDDITHYRAWLQSRRTAGLDFLNARVPHRYTGLYALEDGFLRNLFLHDKRGEVVPELLKVVPFDHSFCQFVLKDGVFETMDSAADARLDGHPYQGIMLSYHGVPVLDHRGELFGTLCHFDMVSHGLPDAEIGFMHKAAREIPHYIGL